MPVNDFWYIIVSSPLILIVPSFMPDEYSAANSTIDLVVAKSYACLTALAVAAKVVESLFTAEDNLVIP